MTRKGEAHETLSLLFHCDGAPPTMVFDCLKEQCQGDFARLIAMQDRLNPNPCGSRPLRVVSVN
jgi:hypothetical protein